MRGPRAAPSHQGEGPRVSATDSCSTGVTSVMSKCRTPDNTGCQTPLPVPLFTSHLQGRAMGLSFTWKVKEPPAQEVDLPPNASGHRDSQPKEVTMQLGSGAFPRSKHKSGSPSHTFRTWNSKNKEMEHHLQTDGMALVCGGGGPPTSSSKGEQPPQTRAMGSGLP